MSLANDLTLASESIIAAFGNTNRYKIKRAASRDGLTSYYPDDPRARLAEFIAFYDTFASQKGLAPAYRRGLFAACAAGQLILTYACRDDMKLVWHAYITHGHKVGLFHSASLFRTVENADRAVIARANRWLHWRDMLHFKSKGLRTYDWGGLFADESVAERAGINNFKREFGGEAVCTYDYSVALTLRGHAYMALRNARERWHRD
jgi:lipid II:glycine glycyltransferase (peptidoglycan interpeptide bridge formation enzyme)